jgi:hypothetical protein
VSDPDIDAGSRQARPDPEKEGFVRRLVVALAALLVACACASSGTAGRATGPASIRPASSAATDSGTGIGHVFVIVLENESYKDAYLHNPNPYLGHTLQQQGTLLTHYYGIGHFSLDNYLAMISGQAPNPTTSSDCQGYSPFKPTRHPVRINAKGQAVGVGCVYPAKVKTLANQLSARGIGWAGYMDHMGAKPGREQKTCGVPHLRHHTDDTQVATRKDQYAARHNPFVYFHSLLNSGLCKSHVVRLGLLPAALRSADTTPRFAFITPDLCNDGHDSPCRGKDSAGSRKGGLVSVDHFLSKWVPRIESSAAFEQDGLLIITSDESEISDSSSCCGEKPGPKDARPGINGPGGGRIGTLMIGKCVAADAKDPTPYNHYSLLRSLEDLYGITTGGTDGKGHLGYAAAPGLRPFGSDVFTTC